MILIGLGANLPSARYGDPVETCKAALAALQDAGVRVVRVSRWYRSAPVPPSDQPWFVNGVAQVETDLEPAELLAVLHKVERDFGRVRRARDEARVIDLDILAYGARVSRPGEDPVLPHPRMADRAFVILPLAELAPDWRHPLTGARAADLARQLPPEQQAEPIE
jgi:2-amino-4-hydroxy-6-hydroxymethyldihydropteridine diphosphokinase